jgi:hypothetical protein
MNARKGQYNGQISVGSLLQAEAKTAPVNLTKQTNVTRDVEGAFRLALDQTTSLPLSLRDRLFVIHPTVILYPLSHTQTWRTSPPSTMSSSLAQVS